MLADMVRCVVLDDYQGVALECADWGGLDVHTVRDHLDSLDELVAVLDGAPVVVAMRERTPFPRELLERLPALRLLVTTGAANVAIDVAAAAQLGICVSGTRSEVSPTVELTWALILAAARGVPRESANLAAGGPWQLGLGRDLAGTTLGVLGLGRLGGRVARIGAAFGMQVVAWSANLTAQRAAEAGVELASSLDDLLGRADVLTVHLQLSDRTRGLLGARELALLRPGALLVNTSRGPIIDEAALIAALADGPLGAAALDVFDVEPLPADHPLRTAPNVVATPHLGYVTERSYRTFFADVVEDIEAFLAGDPVRVLTAPGSD